MNQKLLLSIFVFTLSLLFLGYGVDRVTLKYFSPFSFELFIVMVFLTFTSLYTIYKNTSFQWSLKHILLLGMGIRLALFFAEPNLSDDYFRFIWDGTLIKNGIKPLCVFAI